MEIKNCINAINAYQSNTIKTEYKKTIKAEKKANTDKVEFSQNALGGIDALKASAVKGADAAASTERISALQKAVNDGNYNISAESIAAAMLEG